MLVLFVIQSPVLVSWHCKEIWPKRFYYFHYCDKVEYLLQGTAQFLPVSNENALASAFWHRIISVYPSEMTHPTSQQRSTFAASSLPGVSTSLVHSCWLISLSISGKWFSLL